MTELVHVAGPTLTAGAVRRQRCMWCGALIDEYDLNNMGRPLEPGEDPDAPWEPGEWEPGSLVAVSGTNPVVKLAVPQPDDMKIPADSCMAVEPAVTA